MSVWAVLCCHATDESLRELSPFEESCAASRKMKGRWRGHEAVISHFSQTLTRIKERLSTSAPNDFVRTRPRASRDGKKREETFRRATEEDPSPGWTEQ